MNVIETNLFLSACRLAKAVDPNAADAVGLLRKLAEHGEQAAVEVVRLRALLDAKEKEARERIEAVARASYLEGRAAAADICRSYAEGYELTSKAMQCCDPVDLAIIETARHMADRIMPPANAKPNTGSGWASFQASPVADAKPKGAAKPHPKEQTKHEPAPRPTHGGYPDVLVFVPIDTCKPSGKPFIGFSSDRP